MPHFRGYIGPRSHVRAGALHGRHNDHCVIRCSPAPLAVVPPATAGAVSRRAALPAAAARAAGRLGPDHVRPGPARPGGPRKLKARQRGRPQRRRRRAGRRRAGRGWCAHVRAGRRGVRAAGRRTRRRAAGGALFGEGVALSADGALLAVGAPNEERAAGCYDTHDKKQLAWFLAGRTASAWRNSATAAPRSMSARARAGPTSSSRSATQPMRPTTAGRRTCSASPRCRPRRRKTADVDCAPVGAAVAGAAAYGLPGIGGCWRASAYAMTAGQVHLYEWAPAPTTFPPDTHTYQHPALPAGQGANVDGDELNGFKGAIDHDGAIYLKFRTSSSGASGNLFQLYTETLNNKPKINSWPSGTDLYVAWHASTGSMTMNYPIGTLDPSAEYEVFITWRATTRTDAPDPDDVVIGFRAAGGTWSVGAPYSSTTDALEMFDASNAKTTEYFSVEQSVATTILAINWNGVGGTGPGMSDFRLCTTPYLSPLGAWAQVAAYGGEASDNFGRSVALSADDATSARRRRGWAQLPHGVLARDRAV